MKDLDEASDEDLIWRLVAIAEWKELEELIEPDDQWSKLTEAKVVSVDWANEEITF